MPPISRRQLRLVRPTHRQQSLRQQGPHPHSACAHPPRQTAAPPDRGRTTPLHPRPPRAPPQSRTAIAARFFSLLAVSAISSARSATLMKLAINYKDAPGTPIRYTSDSELGSLKDHFARRVHVFDLVNIANRRDLCRPAFGTRRLLGTTGKEGPCATLPSLSHLLFLSPSLMRKQLTPAPNPHRPAPPSSKLTP